jgi:tetraacyldisaccharide 4'-kinase
MVTSRIAPLNLDDPHTPLNPVAAFCAIGNPQSFFKHLVVNGHEPILRKTFPDHHYYSQSDIDALIAAAKQSGAKSLITTAKDSVKLRAHQFSLPCYSLEVEIKIDNEEEFRRIVLSSLTE